MDPCPRCGNPRWCDCWISAMTPEEREAAMAATLDQHLATIDAKAERRRFLARQKDRPGSRCGRRGTSGDTRGSAKYAGLRFIGQR
jgi:hypothetical protein